MGDDRYGTVHSVERALDVLLLFAGPRAGAGYGVTELAQQMGMAKSSVHRVLSTLERKGFIRQDPVSGRYHLGLKALELAGAYLQSDLPAAAYPDMVRLRDLVEETVSLYVRDGWERVRVQKAEGLHVVRRVVEVGQRLPLHRGASGKVLLAWLPENELDKLLAVMALPPGFDAVGLREALARVREQGWAASAEEREPGVASVAAPIRHRSGEVKGALAVSGPLQRFDPAAIQRYAAACVEVARMIGMRL